MPRHDNQPDLFAEPPRAKEPERPLRPPYTLAELQALDAQMRTFERVPDEWCAGWHEMCDRAHDTIRQTPREDRAAFRAVFFEQERRLVQVELDEVREKEKAAAAAAPAKPRRRPKARRGTSAAAP